MTEAVKKNGVTFGVILGIVSILTSTLIYTVNIELMVSIGVGLGIFALNLIIGIIAVSRAKKQNGGFITFKEAFTTYFITMLIGSVIGMIFSYLLFNIIDPDAKQKLMDMLVEKTVGWMQSAGTKSEDIRKMVEEMQKTDSFSLISLLKSLAMSLVFHAIIGLIVAAVTKKENPYGNTAQDINNVGNE